MKSEQQNIVKQVNISELKTIGANADQQKTFTGFHSMVFTLDPELEKFSGDGFVPEKYKEVEALLVNSILPNSSSFK